MKPQTLWHLKQDITTVGNGNPVAKEGSEGNFTLRKVASGLALFVKHSNRWYDVNELQPSAWSLSVGTGEKVYPTSLKSSVGIGTAAPETDLHVASGDTNGPIFRLENTNTDIGDTHTIGRIQFAGKDTDAAGTMCQIGCESQGTDGSGKFFIQVGQPGGTFESRLIIDKDGVINMSQLTASQDVQTDGSKNLTSVSDMNWKTDLGSIENGLDIVNSFKPHYFKWKRDASGNDISEIEQSRLAGFFAQEVYEAFPEGSPGGDNLDEDGEEHWGLNSRAIIAVMAKAVQELSAKVDTMQTEINSLKG